MATRRWLLPALALVAWLVIGGPLLTFVGKLATVQVNDNAAYLPATAESTRAYDIGARFQDEETLPASVVFARKGGLTAADRAWIATSATSFAEVPAVAADGVSAPIPATDGTAAQVIVDLAATDDAVIVDSVAELRSTVADPPQGLTAVVGGMAGVRADFTEAFGAIDGVLLVVAGTVVLVILLVVYRSPLLAVIVVGSAMLSLGVASLGVYLFAKADILTVSAQSQGILFILAFGAATDYSLLIVSRYREELRDRESKYDAMRAAYRGAFEPILASGTTVIAGLLCLLLSDLRMLSGLGPVGAFGVAGAMLSSLTLLPALLVVFGRQAFWPFRPAYGSEHTHTRGLWGMIARLISRHARLVWVATFAGLLVAASFLSTLKEDPIPQTDYFLAEVESVQAQDLIDAHFGVDAASPLQIVVPVADVAKVVPFVAAYDGIEQQASGGVPPVYPIPESAASHQPKVVDGYAVVLATLASDAGSKAAVATVEGLRTDLDQVSPKALVGGLAAINADIQSTTKHDRGLVIPAILAVIFVVLSLLLRALVAPILLIVANVLSFGATMGISALLFNHAFHFASSDPSTSLIGFVFLVALGIDYSIFLMTRVREEVIRQGTHPGILKGLTTTGGVITSAGVVLAATFAALGVIPILFLAQIGFIVAFGVLLDALIVRSLLVPALCHDAGRVIWWPSRLSREPDHADAETEEMLHSRG